MVVRALGRLGDHKVIDAVLPMLSREEKEIRLEAISSLAKLADERRLEQIRVQIQAQTSNTEQTVAQAALRALSDLDSRFSGERHPSLVDAESFARLDDPPPVSGHRPEGATQAASPQYTQPTPAPTPPPPRPRPEAPPPVTPRPSRRARSSCPSRKCSARSKKPRRWRARRSSTSRP